MAVIDQAEVWTARIGTIADKIKAGEKLARERLTTVSGLIAEGAVDTKIKRARSDAEAAGLELKYLCDAMETAKNELAEAEERQAADVIKHKGERVARLQKRRAAMLREAEDAYDICLARLKQAETLAVEIHEAGAGCAPLGMALNDRHGPIVTWWVLGLLDAMPIAEELIGRAANNFKEARARMEGKSLVDLQDDYAGMFRRFHAEKDAAA